MNTNVFCIMGPTASGKTDLACTLLEKYPFEIISVDSAMIYKEMNIGTAKPSPIVLHNAPHHLIDLISPLESYSAAQFCMDANRCIKAILQNGKIPLLVGGTMMYFNALQKGLASIPEADESIRKALEREIEEQGLDVLYKKLIDIDPEAASRVHAHDAQRIQRALEVYYISGKPLSEHFKIAKEGSEYQFINIGLFPEPRSWLHERIALRFKNMIKAGLVDEVQGLMNKWPLSKNLPSMRCVGYRQVLEYLEGEYDEALLIEKGIAATRQLAKRQLTWLRHWEHIHLFNPVHQQTNEVIIEMIMKILDNPRKSS